MTRAGEQFTEWLAAKIGSAEFDICSRWATKYRLMKDSKPYSLDHYPYVREIMDSTAKCNWIKKGAQTGLTEAAITIAIFTAIRYKKDVIYYFPTKAKMNEFSRSRFDDAIELSPWIGALCRLKNAYLKRFGTASLFLLGANSAADLKSTSASRLLMDEFDEWRPEAVSLAIERLSGQADGDTRLWGFSTPTLPDVGIDAKYAESTRECFFFNCPACNEEIDFTWDEDNLEFHCFEPGDTPAEAFYYCWRCRARLPHDEKSSFLKGGRYQAKRPDGSSFEPDPELKRLNRGFYVPQMLSPGVTPEDLSIKWRRGQGGELAAIREFYNSAIGQPFLEDQHRVTDSHLKYAKVEAHKTHEKLHGGEPFRISALGPIKKEKHFVTLGIDQGGPTHHWAAISWKFDRARYGDPNDRAVGKMIGCGRVMADEWDRVYGLMREFRVRMCVVDFFPQPTEARKFARRFQEFVYLCQYTVGNAGREIRTTEDDYGANLVKVDKTAWLSKTIGRIISGDLLLPIDTPEELEDHVKSLIRTMNKDRVHAEFKKQDGVADHYAHALNYAEIALKILDPALSSSDSIVG